jgi:arsenate reductase
MSVFDALLEEWVSGHWPVAGAMCCCSSAAVALPGATESTMPSRIFNVLFLCTGNSARSIMAEAMVRHYMGDRVHAQSAGTAPQPQVAAHAIAALQLAQLPTEGLYPKDVLAVMDEPFDLIVTVCEHARETCPIFPRPVPSIHVPLHDPHGEPLESFVRVRDEIGARLLPAVRQALGL